MEKSQRLRQKAGKLQPTKMSHSRLNLTGPVSPSTITVLRIMTFNIRCGSAPDGPNSWDERFGTGNRKEMVLEVIKECQPDILGIQEGLKFQVQYLANNLEDYGWVGMSRHSAPENDEYNAIFYKKTYCKLKKWGQFWLSATPDVPGSITWGQPLPRIVTWGEFKIKGYPTTIYVFNTHFPLTSYARAKSADLLYSKATQAPVEHPVFVIGDFNASIGSYAIKKFTENSEFENSYKTCVKRLGPAFTFHDFQGPAAKGKDIIDWIFCRLPAEKGIQRVKVVDFHKDGRYPSDHFPVYADIEL